MPIFIFLLRLMVPMFIPRFPLVGALIALALDTADWPLTVGTHAMAHTLYQPIDKFLDLWMLSFEAIAATRWLDAKAKHVLLGLYGTRFIGIVLFLFTGVRPLLFFFPNIAENFYLFYAAVTWITKQPILPQSFILPVLMVIGIPKLFQEYAQHMIQMPTWQYIPIRISSLAFVFDAINGQIALLIVLIGITCYREINRKLKAVG